MKSYRTVRNEKRRAFSIIELITVMGIIAILIGLLVPALTKVHDLAKNVQQRAQLHAIEVALEMIVIDKADGGLGGYPESKDNSVAPVHSVDPIEYCGANKLAEALVGQDFLGVHPRTDFRSIGTFTHSDGLGGSEQGKVYHADSLYNATNDLYDETADENIDARLGPFIDLENANAYTMEDVWGIGNTGAFQAAPSIVIPFPSLVLCDVFGESRPSGKKTGMPILYYRANTSSKEQDNVTDVGDDIYNYYDNDKILALGVPDSTVVHPIYNVLADFDKMVINPQVTTINRPYNVDSFILISAGKDGLYGTADDITNFKKEE